MPALALAALTAASFDVLTGPPVPTRAGDTLAFPGAALGGPAFV